MKIALLNREYPPHTIFLSSSMLYQRMAKAFAQRGHEVHMICQSDGSPLERNDGGVLVHEVGTVLKRSSAHGRASYSYHAWRKLRELFRQGIDVVNADFFLAEGLLYGLTKSKAPLVLQAHAWAEGWTEPFAGGLLGFGERKIASILERVAAKRADRIIATSNFTRQWLIDKAGVPEGKISVIYEFIDTTHYRPVKSTIRQRLGIGENDPMVLFVAGLEPRKGPLILAKAIPLVTNQMPNCRFVIIGRDTNKAPGGRSMKAYLQALSESRGFSGNLILAGMVSSDDVVEAYSSCDVFVYPGLMEAGGLPPLEAMACNCPVVATGTGVAAELRGISPAFLVVTPGDVEDLAEAIIQLLSMPKQRRIELSFSHRQIVEQRFCFDRMVDAILAVYESAIAE
jgi:glycosyltransferase involved in cell wall biosynthesis